MYAYVRTYVYLALLLFFFSLGTDPFLRFYLFFEHFSCRFTPNVSSGAGNEGKGGHDGKCSGSSLSIDRLSIWSMY